MLSGHSTTDEEFLRHKERELAWHLQQAEILRQVIASMREYLRMTEEATPLKAPEEDRRPNREERVLRLLRSGKKSTDELARLFKISKKEMKDWMEERMKVSKQWTRTRDGEGYEVAG